MTGYNIRDKQGNLSIRRFINTLDYSLDLLKLQEVYEKVYRKKDFEFFVKSKSYNTHVINVTFKYSVKEFNQIRKGLFVRNGYNLFDFVDKISDCVYVVDGDIIAIQTGELVANPVCPDVLGKYFWFEDGIYKAKHNIKTVVGSRQLREYIYSNGFLLDGISYVRWKRSSGSSRVGKCLFINKNLYKNMHKWDLCGLNIKDGDKIDLSAFESYISLTLSSIIDTCELYPENILLVDDYKSVFDDDMIAVTEDDNHELVAERKTTTVSNSIWDGEALLDESVFQENGYEDKGCILLRNRFFKSCCFNVGIQRFFADNKITNVSQLNGFTRAKHISDIKLITTPSSIKYLKFSTIERWLDSLETLFGIVKTDKETKYFNGRMTKVHYQLLNSLQLTYEDTVDFLRPSLEHLSLLKNNPEVVRYHIQYPENREFSLPLNALESKNDIVYRLLDLNEDFARTKLYADFRNDLTKSFVSDLKCGKVLVNGNYEILFGNPLELLKESIGMFDGKSSLLPGEIHTTRFQYGLELLGTRSPHIGSGNILLTKNVSCTEIDRYCNITDEIVCINSINDNILERLSGADFDVDSILLTDNKILIDVARRNYNTFMVPTNLVPSSGVDYRYTNKDKSELDWRTSENLIGEIVNLSQELNSIIWDKLYYGSTYDDIESIYLDVSKLNVGSNIEIDKAKKVRLVDNKKEIKKIKTKYSLRDKSGKPIKPKFFQHIVRKKGYYIAGTKKYKLYNSTMDYIYQVVSKADKKYTQPPYLNFSEILNKSIYDFSKVKYSQVNRVIELVREYKRENSDIWMTSVLSKEDKRLQAAELRQEYINYIDSISFSYHTIYYLLKKMSEKDYSDVSRFLFNLLFGVPNKSFYDAIKKSVDKIPVLVEVIGNRYDLKLYDYKFSLDYLH